MKIINLIIMFAFTLLSSCSIFNYGESEYFRKNVSLLDEKDYTENILFIVYTKDSIELQVPLIKLINYINFEDINNKSTYSHFIDSILKNKPNGSKISTSSIDFDLPRAKKSTFRIMYRRLFESGDYMIYDKTIKTYIKDVIVELDSNYISPIAAWFSYKVYIKGYIFWGLGYNA